MTAGHKKLSGLYKGHRVKAERDRDDETMIFLTVIDPAYRDILKRKERLPGITLAGSMLYALRECGLMS